MKSFPRIFFRLCVLTCLFFFTACVKAGWSSAKEDGLFASNPAPHIMKYGCPQYNPIRVRSSYVVSYDSRNKNTYWSYEYLTKDDLVGPADRKNSSFMVDKSFPEEHQVKLSDYKGSGFDRGHMAPAGDHKNFQEAMDDTFYLSNMTPQFPNFNRNTWRKVESSVRDLLKRDDVISLHVVTGALYLPEVGLSDPEKKDFVSYPVIGEGHVAVPTHIFKVILAEKSESSFEEYAVMVPNEESYMEALPKDFAVTIEDIEKVSGLLFFREADSKGIIPEIDRLKVRRLLN